MALVVDLGVVFSTTTSASALSPASSDTASVNDGRRAPQSLGGAIWVGHGGMAPRCARRTKAASSSMAWPRHLTLPVDPRRA